MIGLPSFLGQALPDRMPSFEDMGPDRQIGQLCQTQWVQQLVNIQVNTALCQPGQLSTWSTVNCVRRTPPPPERQTQSSHSINTAPNTLHRHGAQHLTLTHAPLNNSAQKQSAYEQAVKWTA